MTIVERIRAHAVIGRGTCSTYDECYTDEELQELIVERYQEPYDFDEIVKGLMEDEVWYWERQGIDFLAEVG